MGIVVDANDQVAGLPGSRKRARGAVHLEPSVEAQQRPLL